MKIEEIHKIVEGKKDVWNEEKQVWEKGIKKIILKLKIGLALVGISYIIFTIVIFKLFNCDIITSLGLGFLISVFLGIIFFALWVIRNGEPIDDDDTNAMNSITPKYVSEYCDILAKGISSRLSYESFWTECEAAVRNSKMIYGDSISNYKNIFGEFDRCFFKMGEIRVNRNTIDSDGDRKTEEVFKGIFAECKLRKGYDFDLNIFSQNNTNKMNEKFQCSLENTILDSIEFEKYYEVYSNDKVKTLQVLTAEIMGQLIDLRINNNRNLNISLRDDVLYIALSHQKLFLNIDKYDFENVKEDYINLKQILKVIKFVLSMFDVLD